MHYDHEKNLAEARAREERRERWVSAISFGIYAAVLCALGLAARGSLRQPLFILAAMAFVVALALAFEAFRHDADDNEEGEP